MDKFYIEDAAGGFGFFPYNTIDDYRAVVAGAAAVGRRASGCAGRWARYYLDMTWDTFQSVAGRADTGRHERHAEACRPSVIVDSKNWSVFGQVEYDLAEQWTVIAGLRWSQDDKDLEMRRVYEDVPEGVPPEERSTSTTSAIPGIDTSTTATTRRGCSSTSSPATARCSMPRSTAASRAATGRSIRWARVPDENLKHGEEVLNAYELGLKTDLWDGAARLNIAAFYYDYQDYQAFSILVSPRR